MKEKPFLSFVTRCNKRPNLLAENKASLGRQTDQDFEQVFIVDDVGLGVYEANQSLYKNRHQVKGKYVMIYDDDNVLVDPYFVAILKKIVGEYDPDVIISKMLWQAGIILPRPEYWGVFPHQGEIDSLNFVVRSQIWKSHIKTFGAPKCGDFFFIREVFKQPNHTVYWNDRIVAQSMQIGHGRPEGG